MLSGIANLIFGASDVEDAAQNSIKASCDLNTTTVDNEWVLVDQPDLAHGEAGTHDERPPARLTNLVREPCDGATDTNSNPSSSSSSVGSSPVSSSPGSPRGSGNRPKRRRGGHGLEDSWLVTPPACFTAGGAAGGGSMVASHPLEDLLIEHPSMSVYVLRGREGSTGVESERSESSGVDDAAAATAGGSARARKSAVERKPPCQPRAVAARAGLVAHVESIKPMQRAQQKLRGRILARNKLERANKVLHYQGRRLRRKDHVSLRSGRSNNRRC